MVCFYPWHCPWQFVILHGVIKDVAICEGNLFLMILPSLLLYCFSWWSSSQKTQYASSHVRYCVTNAYIQPLKWLPLKSFSTGYQKQEILQSWVIQKDMISPSLGWLVAIPLLMIPPHKRHNMPPPRTFSSLPTLEISKWDSLHLIF